MTRTLAAIVTAALLLPAVALASLPATTSERAAVVASAKAAGDLSRSFPASCAKVLLAPSDRAWASLAIRSSRCPRFAANGLAVFHHTRGKWHFVTVGSSFETCPPHGVPARVAHDLKLC